MHSVHRRIPSIIRGIRAYCIAKRSERVHMLARDRMRASMSIVVQFCVVSASDIAYSHRVARYAPSEMPTSDTTTHAHTQPTPFYSSASRNTKKTTLLPNNKKSPLTCPIACSARLIIECQRANTITHTRSHSRARARTASNWKPPQLPTSNTLPAAAVAAAVRSSRYCWCRLFFLADDRPRWASSHYRVTQRGRLFRSQPKRTCTATFRALILICVLVGGGANGRMACRRRFTCARARACVLCATWRICLTVK